MREENHSLTAIWCGSLTVASDVMSACSSDEYSTPNETEQEKKNAKEDKALQEEPPCK